MSGKLLNLRLSLLISTLRMMMFPDLPPESECGGKAAPTFLLLSLTSLVLLLVGKHIHNHRGQVKGMHCLPSFMTKLKS